MLKNIVGKNIRTIRKLKGFSQGELAFLAGITQSYWGYIERGQKNPSLELIEKIAAVLEVEPYVLFVYESSENFSSEIMYMLNVINGMGHLHIRFLRDFLNAYIKTHCTK